MLDASHGRSPVINCEREKLEFESVPEFIREPYPSARESYSGTFPTLKPSTVEPRITEEFDLPKTAELEALWPGVNHDFLQPSRRPPSFYLTLGFLAGAIAALAGAWSYSFFSNGATMPGAPQKKIVVAGTHADASIRGQIASENGKGDTGRPIVVDGAEVLLPAYSAYEVKPGDTLAAIVLKAYHRVSPRLLDEVCRANGMRNANVLNLGQKLTLPQYRPQSSQIAAGAGAIQ